MKGYRRVLGLLGLVLATGFQSARAADQSAEFRFGVYLEYEYFSYLTSLGGEFADDRNAITARPWLDWTPQDGVHLHAAVTARKDFSEEDRTDTYAYELYLGVERETWSFSIGREILTWGRADSLRPTDVFRRHDYTDLIEDREEAIDVVRAAWTLGPGTLEGVWAPLFTPDIISYAPENRWTRLPSDIVVPCVGLIDLTFVEDSQQTPPATIASSQGGIRYSGTSGGWDFAGMAYYGYDRVPTFTLIEVESFLPRARTATIRLLPIHERIAVVGADFAKAISRWTVRGEAAYTRTAEPDPRMRGINEPYYRFSGGVDRTISSAGSAQSLSISLQYALDTEPEQTLPPNQQNINPLLHPYNHAFIVNSIWKFTDNVQFNFTGYVNLVDEDFVLQPEIAWKPIDSMMVVLGGDVIGGQPTTFFGRYSDNDRVRLLIAYNF